MSETLRALLHRHADELADKLAELASEAPAAKAKAPKRTRMARPIVVEEIPVDEATKARALRFVRRAGL